MIKSWQQFNESSVYFEGSTEFLKVRKKYALEKGDILDFLQDLEDENERCVSDLSNLEKNIDKLKMENAELKSKVVINFKNSSDYKHLPLNIFYLKVNDVRILKEHEETLLLDIANLKNEIK